MVRRTKSLYPTVQSIAVCLKMTNGELESGGETVELHGLPSVVRAQQRGAWGQDLLGFSVMRRRMAKANMSGHDVLIGRLGSQTADWATKKRLCCTQTPILPAFFCLDQCTSSCRPARTRSLNL